MRFVVGDCRSVVESDFYTKIKKLDVKEGKRHKLFSNYVLQVYKAHNQVRMCASSSRSKEVRGQPQRDRGRTSGTICTCREIKRGTLAYKASKLGLIN